MTTYRSNSVRPVVLVMIAAWCATAAAGTIEEFQFSSTALDGEDRWVQAYLPDGYDPADPHLYPVIYFLHGATRDHTSNPALLDTLDVMIEDGRIDPVIMIKPDGGFCDWDLLSGCGWVNSDLQGDYEDYVVEDVVAEAEYRYNICAGPENRAIMGLSMGGFGAMYVAVKHPGHYCAVASHSGYLYFDDFLIYQFPAIIDEQTDGPPYEWDPNTGYGTSLMFLFAGGFSPNELNRPYLVDLPLDEWGDVVPETWLRWKEHDPAVLAEAIDPETAPAIYFDCGTQDALLFHPLNVSFYLHLTSLGIEHEWQSFEGGHSDVFHTRIPISLAFIDTAWDPEECVPTAVAEPSPSRSRTLQAFPNPCNPRTTITLSLEHTEWAEVGVYDLTGHRVTTLASRTFTPGPHTLTWNGRDSQGRAMPSGTYIVRLSTDSGVEARKVALIR